MSKTLTNERCSFVQNPIFSGEGNTQTPGFNDLRDSYSNFKEYKASKRQPKELKVFNTEKYLGNPKSTDKKMADIELRPFQNKNGTSIVSPVARGNSKHSATVVVTPQGSSM